MSNIIFSILLSLPLLGAIFCAVLRSEKIHEFITLFVSSITFITACFLAYIITDQIKIFSAKELLYADSLSALVILIVTMSALSVSIYSIYYLRIQKKSGQINLKQQRLYYTLLNVFLFTMLFVLLSNNIGFIWIGSEASTLATAFLVAFYEKERSLEAAWKYIIICSVGIALALFGIILTYYSALTINNNSSNVLLWTNLIQLSSKLDPAILKLAFIFILVGFGTKAGLAPFHTWKPDAYGEAPSPISALMAGGLVNVAIYSLIRFYIIVTKSVGTEFTSKLFIFFGILSMAISVPFILIQKDYKRLLAYSSVEHVGIIIFAVGIATPLAYLGALLHMLNNAIAKIAIFLTAGNIRLTYHSKIINRVAGAIKVMPISAVFFIIAIFAVTGWPPFGIFISEFTIASAGFASNNIFVTILFLFCISTVFIGFIYYGSKIVFGTPHHNIPKLDIHPAIHVLIGTLILFLLLLGLCIPNKLWLLLQCAAKVLQG